MFWKYLLQNHKTIPTIIFKELWHTELSFNFKCGAKVCWNTCESVFILLSYCSRETNLKGHRPKMYCNGGVYMHIKFTAFVFSSFQSQKWWAIYSSILKEKFPVLQTNKWLLISLLPGRVWIFTVRGWSLHAVTQPLLLFSVLSLHQCR